MASVTHRNSTASTANASSYASGSFTPAAGELLGVFVTTSATIAGGTMIDSQGLGFSLVCKALKATSLDTLYFFVANKLAAASSMTVTFECTGDAATSANIQVWGISSMTRTGYDAVRQFKVTNNGAAAGTPAATFDASCLTGNPTLGVVGNASNPAAMTPPTNWTEQNDTGIDTPNTGSEYVSRDSGFTGTTITWGGTSATAFGVIIAEMDTSAVGAEPQFKSLGTMATGTGTAVTSNMPADWGAGDIMFLSLGLSLTTPTTSDPSGWTKVPGGSEGNPIDGATDVRHYLWYRVAQGGDTAPSLTLSISDDWETVMFNYAPVDGTTPINASAGDDFADTTAVSFTTVTITPSVNNTRIVIVAFTDKTTTPVGQLYSFNGSNERAKIEGNSALMFGLADKIGPAASVAVSQSFTISSTDFPAVFIIALAPSTATYIDAVGVGAITVSGAGVSQIVVPAAATGSIVVAGVGTGLIPYRNAVGAGSVLVSGAGVSQTVVPATATGTVTVSGVASGQVVVPTVGQGTVTVGGVATGVVVVPAAATGSVVVSGVAVGSIAGLYQDAVGVGAVTVAGSASAQVVVPATAQGTVSIDGLAAGAVVTDALGASTLAVSGVAAAQVIVAAQASGTIVVAGTALPESGISILGQIVVSIFPVGRISPTATPLGSVHSSICTVGQVEGGMISVGKAEGTVVKTGDIGVEVIEG